MGVICWHLALNEKQCQRIIESHPYTPMNKETTFYTCLIEERDDLNPFVQAYWAHAEEMGRAIEMMLDVAKENGLQRPFPRQCDPYDIKNLPDDIERSSDAAVFWTANRYAFPPGGKMLDLPVGIIASCIEGDHDIEEIEQGFTVFPGDKLKTIAVNVGVDQLEVLYGKILELFPVYKVFWCLLHDHWNDDSSDLFFVNEDLNSPARINAFIAENRANTILNGYITLTSYLEEGATNINISDHKRIIVRTYSKAVVDQISTLLESNELERKDSIVSIDAGIHHWHYRVRDSLGKEQMKALLKSLGFKPWTPGS